MKTIYAEKYGYLIKDNKILLKYWDIALSFFQEHDAVLFLLEMLIAKKFGTISSVKFTNFKTLKQNFEKYDQLSRLEAIKFMECYLDIKKTIKKFQEESFELSFLEIKPIQALDVLNLFKQLDISLMYPKLEWERLLLLPFFFPVDKTNSSYRIGLLFTHLRSDLLPKKYRVWYDYQNNLNAKQMSDNFWRNYSVEELNMNRVSYFRCEIKELHDAVKL